MPPIHRLGATGDVLELGKDISGPPLGCDEYQGYPPFVVHLDPGDTLVMYTDGINEAMNPDRELYGVDRVRRTLKAGPTSVGDSCQALLDDVRQFAQNRAQDDDMCLIGVQRK
jgi:sigma-B regulation protein RsbU (phosphoserine phosphatase)